MMIRLKTTIHHTLTCIGAFLSCAMLCGCSHLPLPSKTLQLTYQPNLAVHKELQLAQEMWVLKAYHQAKHHVEKAEQMAPDQPTVLALMALIDLSMDDNMAKLSLKRMHARCGHVAVCQAMWWAGPSDQVLDLHQWSKLYPVFVKSQLPVVIWQFLGDKLALQKSWQASIEAYHQVADYQITPEVCLKLAELNLKRAKFREASIWIIQYNRLHAPSRRSLQIEQDIATAKGNDSAVASLKVLQNALSFDHKI